MCSLLFLQIDIGLSQAITLPDVISLIKRYCPFNSSNHYCSNPSSLSGLRPWWRQMEGPSCKSRQSCPISLQRRAVCQGKHERSPSQNNVCQPAGLCELAAFDKTHKHEKTATKHQYGCKVWTMGGGNIHQRPFLIQQQNVNCGELWQETDPCLQVNHRSHAQVYRTDMC